MKIRLNPQASSDLLPKLSASFFGGIVDFEKLDVWKMSTELSVAVYRGMKNLRDFGFKDQITRSSLSIPSNIAEGMSRVGDREKVQFLNIAKGSCSELRTQIYIGIEIDYIDQNIGKSWIEQTKRIASMLSGLMKKLDFRVSRSLINLPQG